MDEKATIQNSVSGSTLILLVVYAAGCGCIIATDGSSSIVRAILGYPLLAVFPAYFFLAAIGGKRESMPYIFPAAVILGPVIGGMMGIAPLFMGLRISYSAPSIMAGGAVFGIVAVLRKQSPPPPRPEKSWIPVLIFSAALITMILVIVVPSMKVRLIYEGWFHQAVSYRAIFGGVPPENPVFPGYTVRHYWFYHTWGAILSWVFWRPPADMFSFINVHALIGAVLGIWICSGQFFRRTGARFAALLLAVMGMNSAGILYLAYHYLKTGVSFTRVELPIDLLSHMLVHGDYRITQLLDKFIAPNAFPTGVSLFAVCLYLMVYLIRGGYRRTAAVALFTTTLGSFLFHPITALGLGIGIGCGLAFYIGVTRDFKRIPYALVIATGLAAAAALPYMLTIVGSGSEKVGIGLSGRDAWKIFASYVLIIPLAFYGAVRLIRSKTPEGLFVTGFCAGIFAAAVFIKLPGLPRLGGNEYKFILLLAIPAGVLSADFFSDGLSKISRKAVLAAFVILTSLNTAFLCYSWMKSEWWIDNSLYSRGIYLHLKKPLAMERIYDWIRENTAPDSVLTYPSGPEWMTCFTARSVASTFRDVFSQGYPGQEERMNMVARLYYYDRLAPQDMDYLRNMNRPVYVILPPAFTRNTKIVEKFFSAPQFFTPVYQADEFIVYRLSEK